MHESPFSYSNLESPAPGTTLPPGRHVLRGWVWPKAGGHLVDVRALVGDRLFAAVHGFPRADLAAHFQTGRPVALAEFSVVVELSAGPVDVVLEALEIEGGWRAFQRVSFQVDGTRPRADVAVPSGPLRWHEYGRLLQTLLRELRRRPGVALERLAQELVASVPYPRDLRHPHLPFHGHLDEPAAITRCGFGRAAVLGWLFHETQPIQRVLATFDLQAWQTIEHGRPSPGPGAHFPSFANAAHAGVFGIIDVPAQLPDPVCLRLYAELADGSLHLCSVQRSRLYTQEDEKGAYAPGAVPPVDSALRGALRAAGLELVEDDELRREVARIQSDHDLRAPRALSAVAPFRPAPAAPDKCNVIRYTSPETDKAVPGTLQAAQVSGSTVLPRRIVLVSHNLNLEGAPLFLVDLATHYAAQGAQLTVLTPADGPLRARFEACGARIVVVDAAPVFAAVTRAEAESAIAVLGRTFDFAACDLVVCNTFTTFWAVHAAKAASRPVLLYVHESTTPASFYLNRVKPEVVALVDAAFAAADRVSFTTASTRSYHTDYGRPGNHRLAPGWIDVARIDRWMAANPRESLRARFKLQPGELLVTNVGTVCDRKGQHIFARAVDLLWRRHPALAARTRFVMLGGGDTPFDAVLADLLAHLARPNLEVHAATADYFPYYAAADLFVCSTYEESSPRVILETMAVGVPILSSGVHGVTEQVRPGLEATLVPPGDTAALAEAMATLLSAPAIGAELAARARARVSAEFDAAILLPRHAALAAETAGAQLPLA